MNDFWSWNTEHWILWYGFCLLFGLLVDPFEIPIRAVRSFRAAWDLTWRATVWLKLHEEEPWRAPKWVYRQRTKTTGVPVLWCVKCRRPARFAIFLGPTENREVTAMCHRIAERVDIPLTTPRSITVFVPSELKMRCGVGTLQARLLADTSGIKDPNTWGDFWVFFQSALNIDRKELTGGHATVY